MRGLLYFGHPVNTYGTRLEEILLKKISKSFPNYEIENSNQKCHQDGYQQRKEQTGNGMDYYTEEVLPRCDGGIFLPFRDGLWGAGVFAEARFFTERGLSIWEIFPNGIIASPDLNLVWSLTINETRQRIRNDEGTIIPY